MNKNIKKFTGIALVALLASCNGSAITKEEAKEVAKGVTKYQAENAKTLYKDGIHYATLTEEKKGSTKTSTTKIEAWYNEDSHFLHYVSETKNESESQQQELYLGEIDGKFYQIDMIKKEYNEYESLIAFEVVYKASATAVLSPFYAMSTGTSLETQVAEEDKDTTYTYKSKGDGHLYIRMDGKTESDDSSIVGKGTLIFNNYKFSSYEAELESTEKDGTKSSVNATMNASYNVSAKMPSLNGLTKK